MIESHGLDAKAAKPVMKCINHLKRNARWLHYDRALAEGLPIATGVIEGACRHLVQDRMGRTGARAGRCWVRRQCCACARYAPAANFLYDYWQFHLAKGHQRNHASHYADGVVPDPIPQPRPNLRVVK